MFRPIEPLANGKALLSLPPAPEPRRFAESALRPTAASREPSTLEAEVGSGGRFGGLVGIGLGV